MDETSPESMELGSTSGHLGMATNPWKSSLLNLRVTVVCSVRMEYIDLVSSL